MAKYNFLDPYQEQEYLQKVEGAGLDIGGAQRYVESEKKKQLQSLQTTASALKAQKDILSLTSGSSGKPLSDLTEFEKKTVNARIAGEKALKILESGVKTGPIESRLQKAGEFFGVVGTGTDYRSALNLASSQLFNALAGTTQSPAELKRLEKLIPSENDQEAVAKRKLQTLMGMLDTQASAYGIDLSKAGIDVGNDQEDQQVGLDLEPEQPAFNISGVVAKPGDLIQTPDGSLKNYGDSAALKSNVFKRTKSGNVVENGFLKFLAESEALPIAGSVLGAFAGAGLGSVATSAVGAGVGKAMQQGIRELMDPERQDLSDMAQAVLIEGATDAILGGTFFAIGKGAKTGLKLVLGKGAEEVVGVAGKEVAGEVVEQGVKSPSQKVVEGLTQTGLGINPSTAERASRSIKGDIIEEVSKRPYRSLKQAAEQSGKELDTAIKTLDDLLSKSGDVKTKDVVAVLQDAQYKMTSPSGDVIPTAESGVKEIQKWISYTLGFGDDISMKEVNEIKRGLQEVFPKTNTEITKASKKVVADASSMVREFIEKNGVDGIADTNKEIQISGFVKDAAVTKLNSKKFKFIGDLVDLSMGLSHPELLVGRKALQVFFSEFDDIARANLIKSALDSSVAAGNRTGVRNILRFSNMAGLDYAATALRAGAAGVGASAITSSTEPQPGLDVEQEIQPGFMYR